MIGTAHPRRRWLIALACLALAPMAATADPIPWRNRYATAQQEAARSGMPVIVSVSSRGCGWCRELDRTTFRDPRVVGLLNGRAVPLKIDANDPAHEPLVEALGIRGVPTLAVITPDGRIVANRAGYLDPEEFLAWIAPIVGP